MTLSTEIALMTTGTRGIALELATGVPEGIGPYAQEVTKRPSAEGAATKMALIEDHIATEVGRLLEDVRTALHCDLTAAKRSATRLAELLASKFADDARIAPARGGLAPWQKRKVQNWIQDGLEGPLPVEDLARLVSLSSSYFCRAFKESFGEPPHAYVVRMRIDRARTLMTNTSESLSQIALACGLVDQAHLCKCFRQVMGTTPGAWRRTHAVGS